MRKTKSPAAVRRWGFLLSAGGLLLLLLAALLFNLAGCARGPVRTTFVPLGPEYSARQDSLGLEQFLALPAGQRQARREQSRLWVERADHVPRLAQTLGCLANAAGLTPDDAATWCRLAEIRRWAGDYVQASTYLSNAEQALARMDRAGDNENWLDCFRRLVLDRAWLHYDRGEYGDARRWLRTGRQMSEGDADFRRIGGLVAASLNQRSRAHGMADDILRADPADPDAGWILGVLDRNQGNLREAFNFVGGLRPDNHHAAECYRDMGEIAELLGEWTYARRWYEESAAAVPLDDSSVLRRTDHPRLSGGVDGPLMPVWLAYSRYYSTGSLSAYAAAALARFEAASEVGDKDFWAGQVVDVTGTLVRRMVDRPQALRARGLVFSYKGMVDRARKDLRRADRMLEEEGLPDARVKAELGHLWLLEEDHEKALPPLRAALALEPDLARAWSDLGLCHIMAKQEDQARQALTRAITLQPDLAAAWYNRGLMNVHAGRWAEARDDLSQAARLTPDNPEIGRLLQQVQLKLRNP